MVCTVSRAVNSISASGSGAERCSLSAAQRAIMSSSTWSTV